MKIGILDYNACNISSIYYSIYRLGLNPIIIKNAKELESVDRLIIPGVGAAKSCLDYLRETLLFDAIKKFLLEKKPILGICLGFQIFAKTLHEHGISSGFGLIDADVIPFKDANLFNIGWSNVVMDEHYNLPQDIIKKNDYYFCHSHYLRFNSEIEKNNCIGHTRFNVIIPSFVIKKNFMGVQFHPEKSQKNGESIIKYFLNWSPK